MAQARRTAREAGTLDLASLGLDRTASAVYEQLLRSPDADPATVAKAIDASCANVDVALSQLVQAGLARPSERALRVEALRPEAALAQQISLKQRDAAEHVSRLSELREDIGELDRLWRRSHLGEVEAREFEIVRGLDAANERIEGLLADARHRVLSAAAAAPVLFDDAFEELCASYVRRNVIARCIIDLVALEEPSHVAAIERLSALGERFRFVSRVWIPLRVIDDVAVLPLDPDNTAKGIVLTRAAGVVETAEAAFWRDWERATEIVDLRPSRDKATGAIDARLPRLLASGAPDDALARVLGVSTRTVRRQVALLMQDLGAQSRLQLGIALERRGLLARPNDLAERQPRS